MSEKELNIREEVRQKVKERTKVCRALQQKINEELDELHKLIQIKKRQVA
jgi:hypothetical protein